MTAPKVLLYTNRENEIDEYVRLIGAAELSLNLIVCRDATELNGAIEDAEIIFGVHLTPDSYARATKLRWIQSMWAGVEGILGASLPAGVILTKPWGVFGPYLSQYVFGNLLAQKINYLGAMKSQSEKKWQPYRIDLLNGKCLGIAGLGDVAADTARAARAFGMKVWALNSDGRDNPLADRTFSSAEKADRVSFVAGLDVLVLTLPKTPSTCGMFNAELLGHLRPESWLINLGRGALIEDAALIELLEQKRIAAAVLDVFNEEPLPPDHPYWNLPNCTVTPHIAGPSLPADITACFVQNYKRFQSGEPLLGVVNLQRGY